MNASCSPACTGRWLQRGFSFRTTMSARAPIGRCCDRHSARARSDVSAHMSGASQQLRDAARLMLTVQRRALEHGMSLKDPTAYNVQFLRSRPVDRRALVRGRATRAMGGVPSVLPALLCAAPPCEQQGSATRPPVAGVHQWPAAGGCVAPPAAITPPSVLGR